jgi:iron complex transport system ATP-binding protein
VSSGSNPLVELRDVVVRIDGSTVLGPVSLSVLSGQRWVLLGPNGCGKTTLLTVVGARRQPSSGTARVLGLTLGRGDVRSLHPDIGHTSHALSEMFPPHLRVIDVVLTGKRAALSPWFQEYVDADLARADDRLDDVGCGRLRDRIFETCSQGERQRVLLARAMFSDPRLLVLDEPSAGLDLPAREALIEAVERSVARSGELSIVIATHHLEEIPPSTTHAALLRAGRTIAAGPIRDVLTAENLRRCFDLDVEVTHRAGRWQAFVVPSVRRPAANPSISPG